MLIPIFTVAELWRLLSYNLPFRLVSHKFDVDGYALTSFQVPKGFKKVEGSETIRTLFWQSVIEVFITGGLPPLVQHPDTVYKSLFSQSIAADGNHFNGQLLGKVAERNQQYYKKYPEDVRRVKDIIRFITKEKDIALPCGGTLSVLRLRQLGIIFGFHHGLDSVHGKSPSILLVMLKLKKE